MNWIPLTDSKQLLEITERSNSPSVRAVLIFKHSTRCSISSMALHRLESSWIEDETIPTYYLDLITYRSISDTLATSYSTEHQSPQVLLIKNEKCIYTNSHNGIRSNAILEAMV